MATAYLGYEIDSSAAKRAAVDLDAMEKSAKRAETGQKRLASSGKQSAAATRDTTTATRQLEGALDNAATSQARMAAGSRAATTALRAQQAASRAAMHNSRQLSFQLIDIGQALATAPTMGIYALQNLGFQVAQIGQLYMGRGGFNQAIKDSATQVGAFITRLGPLAAVAATVGVAFVGLRHEINKTGDVQVGLGDVMLGTLVAIRDGIYSILKPAIDAIAPWFSAAWNGAVSIVARASNLIIGHVVGQVQAILAAWDSFPAALGDLAFQAADAFIIGMKQMAREAIIIVGDVIRAINSAAGTSIPVPLPSSIKQGGIDNPFAGAAQDAAGKAAAAYQDALSVNYAGNAFDVIASNARKIAIANKEVEDSAGKAGSAMQSAYERAKESIIAATQALNIDRSMLGFPDDLITQFSKEQELLNAAIKDGRPLTAGLYAEIERLARGYADAEMATNAAKAAQEAYQKSVQFARDVTGGFISDLRNGLRQGESFWQAFGNAASRALDKIADRLLNQVLDAIFQVNSAASGISFGGGGGGFLSGIFGGIGRLLGFSSGGYTGSGPRNAVAGVVHGQEYVMNAAATARYRPQLEAMNAGRPANSNVPQAANINLNLQLSGRLVDEGGQIVAMIDQKSIQNAAGVVAEYDKEAARTFGARMANAQARQF